MEYHFSYYATAIIHRTQVLYTLHCLKPLYANAAQRWPTPTPTNLENHVGPLVEPDFADKGSRLQAIRDIEGPQHLVPGTIQVCQPQLLLEHPACHAGLVPEQP